MRATGILACVLAVLLMACGVAEDRRNPFGVPDVPNPDGADAQQLAKAVKLAGDAKDANAEPWVTAETKGQPGSIDGEWLDRWSHHGHDGWHHGKGTTRIKTVEDRVYMLVKASNAQFLLDLKRTKNRLVGKYQGVDTPEDTGPIVLLIVDDERIDGNWRDLGRWDFRRKLKK